MTNEPKDLEIILTAQAQADIDADPKLAEAMRQANAAMRQANADVESGRYPDMTTALAAVGIEFGPVDLSDGDDDLPPEVLETVQRFEACKTRDDLVVLLKDLGVELTPEQLAMTMRERLHTSPDQMFDMVFGKKK